VPDEVRDATFSLFEGGGRAQKLELRKIKVGTLSNCKRFRNNFEWGSG